MGDLDQGSSYSVLRNIPVMASSHYRLPKQINISKELITIPQDLLLLNQYSFAVERQTLDNVARLRQKRQEDERALAEQAEVLRVEKVQRQKAAARKIAPGFLDTDTRILHPQPFNSNSKTLTNGTDDDYAPVTTTTATVATAITSTTTIVDPLLAHQPSMPSPAQASTSSSPPPPPPLSVSSPHQQHTRLRSSSNPASPEKRISGQSPLDYQKFEQGLAPLDPWDTPENDFVALRSILGSDSKAEPPVSEGQPYSNAMTMPTPQYPSHYVQHQQPQHTSVIMPGGYSPATDGPWVRPPTYPPHNVTPQHQPVPPQTPPVVNGTPQLGPALPPKVYKEKAGVSANMASSPPPPPPLPPQLSSPKRPPLPPYPTNGSPTMGSAALNHVVPTPSVSDPLVQELASMGFSHQQAIDALSKNENDLVRATNFLLDNV